jgi:peptidoglycan/xylan/chitin deacetylase (PgdA/CDA1 family)
MNWEQIRELHKSGIRFGSHTATHPMLTTLNNVDVTRELARSRAILSRELGQTTDCIAYPHGNFDASIAHLAGACGYQYAVTCRPWLAAYNDPMLMLPRIEVMGTENFQQFVTRVTRP